MNDERCDRDRVMPGAQTNQARDGELVFLSTLMDLSNDPWLIASAARLQHGFPERRCRWWVKRHKWVLSRHMSHVHDGHVVLACVYCKRCRLDRIWKRPEARDV